MPQLYATLLDWHCSLYSTMQLHMSYTYIIILFYYFGNAVIYFLFQLLYMHTFHCSLRYLSLATLKGEIVCKH